MQTTSASARPALNLDAELAYWRNIHAIGRLGEHDFEHYRRLLLMGFKVYTAYPRATEEQLYKVLQDSYHRHVPRLPLSWDEARWLVRHAWSHVDASRATH
jgi:predicted nuclease with RNAse H fold